MEEVLDWPLAAFLGALKQHLRERAERTWWEDRLLYAMCGGTKPKPEWPLGK